MSRRKFVAGLTVASLPASAGCTGAVDYSVETTSTEGAARSPRIVEDEAVFGGGYTLIAPLEPEDDYTGCMARLFHESGVLLMSATVMGTPSRAAFEDFDDEHDGYPPLENAEVVFREPDGTFVGKAVFDIVGQ